jgi:hypothetical protein
MISSDGAMSVSLMMFTQLSWLYNNEQKGDYE